jgi:glutamate 5-kinase
LTHRKRRGRFATTQKLKLGRSVILKPSLANFSRIVIKIGSASLVDQETGIRDLWLTSLIRDVADLCDAGAEVLIVSSGSVALGRKQLADQGVPISAGPLLLEESQAAAAIGQIALCHAYHKALKAHGLTAAQILLTLGDTEQRRRYLNARSTIQTALKWKSVPIINENDSVATAEIRYGDNDRLAARVASMVAADLLILLSDIDGLYTAAPHLDPNAKHLEIVDNITPAIEAMGGDAASEFSRGGMRTKIEAAKIATSAGTTMVITSADQMHPLSELNNGKKATWFRPSETPINQRKRWIAGGLGVTGQIQIDSGALVALERGKSLLPVGVTAVKGDFDRGATVKIISPNGTTIGQGLSEYDSAEAKKIIGLNSAEVSQLLGPNIRSVLIHRDDMVVDI